MTDGRVSRNQLCLSQRLSICSGHGGCYPVISSHEQEGGPHRFLSCLRVLMRGALPEHLGPCCHSCCPSHTTTKVIWRFLFIIYPGTWTYPTFGRSLGGSNPPPLWATEMHCLPQLTPKEQRRWLLLPLRYAPW